MIEYLAIPVAAVVGAWLHELTHAAAAIAVGGRVDRINLLQLGVLFEVASERWATLVRWAPFAIGLGALPILLTTAPRASEIMGWAVFTLAGGADEPGVPWLLDKLFYRDGQTTAT